MTHFPDIRVNSVRLLLVQMKRIELVRKTSVYNNMIRSQNLKTISNKEHHDNHCERLKY